MIHDGDFEPNEDDGRSRVAQALALCVPLGAALWVIAIVAIVRFFSH